MAGVVIAAPPGYSGANALAVAPRFEANETHDFEPARAALQTPLFLSSGQKVIPFDQIQKHVTGRLASVAPSPVAPSHVVPEAATPASAPVKPAPSTRRSPAAAAGQGTLDFLPAGHSAPRTLKTEVPAQIYCEQPVATPTHRFVASSMDAAMILLAFGLFAAVSAVAGGSFGEGSLFWMTMGAALALISLFYGLLWSIAGRETAGMHWTDLQLITFDGFPVEHNARAVRVASTWLSFCSGGLGLLWAMADEENLTWHDHISKTFPTIREAPRSFVRQRSR